MPVIFELGRYPVEEAARSLHRGGADCIVLCTNTMHKVADRIAAAVTIPFLHIADPVGEAARQSHASVLGLLGTRYTMGQPFLRERLERRYGVKVLVPDDAERADLHQIIYEQLGAGVILDSSRQRCQSIIDSLARRGADAVILGCTEIMLLIGQDDSRLPLLDTTALHARAAVDFALGEC